jgi:hypothetical protein
VETAVGVHEAQFLEFIHEVINCDRVVPTISANVSCDFGQNPSFFPNRPSVKENGRAFPWSS